MGRVYNNIESYPEEHNKSGTHDFFEKHLPLITPGLAGKRIVKKRTQKGGGGHTANRTALEEHLSVNSSE